MIPTYEQQLNLVAQGYAVKKTEGIFDTFKYHRRVMFDNLWENIPGIMECRGHVYDNRNGRLVQLPPSKSFNYMEKGWWKGVPMDTPVKMYKKLNGFTAAATIYEGELLVSTTGTINSDFAKLAKAKIEASGLKDFISSDTTTVFEIVDESDPHIVEEKAGAHLLGWRYKNDGEWNPVALASKVKEVTLYEALDIADKDRGEGFMVYRADKPYPVCKLKTPYYVGKKMLMRMTDTNVHKLWSGIYPDRLPFVWYTTVQEIVLWHTKEEWLLKSHQERRKFIEQVEHQTFNPN